MFLTVTLVFLGYSYVITYRARWRRSVERRWWPPTGQEITLWATTLLVLAIASIPSLNLVPSP